MAASRENLRDLREIITKLPINVCIATVFPEMRLQWRDVSKAIRNSRLPMTPSSVAQVIVKHAARAIPDVEIADILAILSLKLAATQNRKWHVIDLLEPIEEEESIGYLIRELPDRVAQALTKSRGRQTMTPNVHTVLVEDLLYMSVRMESARKTKSTPVLYVATPPGQPVALVSSVNSSLLKGCVAGLGYRKHEDPQLSGRDIISLLRIHERNHNENINHLDGIPEYNPTPVITANGIDYTHKAYDEQYVDVILGPDPPLLTELNIQTSKPFYDPTRLVKNINMTVTLKSENVAKTLKSWVQCGAIAPTSEFFQIFHVVKSNNIAVRDDDDLSGDK